MLSAAPIGLTRIGGTPVKIAERVYTYSGLLPTRGTLGMARPGLARLARPAAIAAAKRPKKQTGIPLRAAWQPTNAPINAATRGVFTAPTQDIFAPRLPWAEPQAAESVSRITWGANRADDASRRARWAGQHNGLIEHIAPRRSSLGRVGYARPGIAPVGGAPARTITLQDRSATDTSARMAFTASRPVDASQRMPWSVYDRFGDASERGAFTASKPADSSRRLPWGIYAVHADASDRSAYTASKPIDVPERFPFGVRKALQNGWTGVVVPGGPTVDQNGTIIVPIKGVYFVSNQANLVLLPSGNVLNATSVTVSIDADSFAWSLSADLRLSDWSAVQANANGDPVIVQATINGYQFNAWVESRSRSRAFGSNSVRISGRGITAELDAPYAPIATYDNAAAAKNAQQIITDALTNTGWVLDWQATDWLVPAGGFTAKGTPMDVARAVAGAIDGVIQGDAIAKTLHVLPRYKVPSWQWATATPDVSLPINAVITDSIDDSSNPAYNRVYVSGTTGFGRIGVFTRDGTAGDVLAPSVSDALITAIEASRQRATAELSKAGQSWQIGISAPISDEIPLLGINQLVNYDQSGEDRRGMVRGQSVSASWGNDGLTVRQSAKLEVR